MEWAVAELESLLDVDASTARDILSQVQLQQSKDSAISFFTDLLGYQERSLKFMQKFLEGWQTSKECAAKDDNITESPKRATAPQKTKPIRPEQVSSTRNLKPELSVRAAPDKAGRKKQVIIADITELETYIKQLEVTQSARAISRKSQKTRRCDCQAREHPLNTITPNCLSCGKIICKAEGIGPCTSCLTPVMTYEQYFKLLAGLKSNISSMKQDLNRKDKPIVIDGTKKVGWGPIMPTPAVNLLDLECELNAAEETKQRLISFDKEHAERSRIIDEATDYDEAHMFNSKEHQLDTVEAAAQDLIDIFNFQKALSGNDNRTFKQKVSLQAIDLSGNKLKMGPVFKNEKAKMQDRQTVAIKLENLQELQSKLTKDQMKQAVELAASIESDIKLSIARSQKSFTSASNEVINTFNVSPIIKDYLVDTNRITVCQNELI